MDSPRALLIARGAVALVAASLQFSAFFLAVRTLRDAPDGAHPAAVAAAVSLAYAHLLTASSCRETGRVLRPALAGGLNPFALAVAIFNLRASFLEAPSWAYVVSLALAGLSVPIVPRIARAEAEEVQKEKVPVLAV